MMKNLLWFFLSAITCHQTLVAQCDGSYTFYDQADLDAFFTANASCDSIDSLWISMAEPGSMDPISNLSALENLTAINHLTLLNWNGDAIDYSPLNNLVQLNDLETNMVHDFSFCSNLTDIDKLIIEFNITSNPQGLILDLSGFDNLVNAGVINLGFNDPLSDYTNIFPSLVQLSQLQFYHWFDPSQEEIRMNTLDGFHQVQTLNQVVIGEFYPFICSNLTIFNQIESCIVLGITAQIVNFNSFQNLQHAEIFYNQIFGPPIVYPQLQTLGNARLTFTASSNYAFPALTQASLFGFELSASGDDVNIDLDFPVLNELDTMKIISYGFYPDNFSWEMNVTSLDSIHQQLDISGTLLTNLQFLSSLEYIGGSIIIAGNIYLSNCSVFALCERLAAATSGVYIQNDLGDCEDISAVMAACTAPQVSGNIFYDLNCNQIYDDVDLPYAHPILTSPSNVTIASGNSLGHYQFPSLTPGDITFQPQIPPGTFLLSPFTFNADTLSSDLEVNFGFCPTLDYNGVEITCSPINDIRPGFNSIYEIIVRNNSLTTESASISLELSLFANYTNFSASQPYLIVDDTFIFDPIALGPFEQMSIEVTGTLSPATPLSTPFISTAHVSILNTDQDPTNNTAVFNGVVVGSYDPNDIMVNTPLIDVEQADANGDWLTYRIRFQNTGNFPAEFINVVSEQDEWVDMSTMQMIDASHANTWSFDGREVTWFFDNIQLPDSLSDPDGSQGYIIYKVRTMEGLGVGDVLEVHAAIYFDFNEPVITNTASTEYYLCPADLIVASDEPAVCQYDWATAYASDGYESYTWSVDNQVLSTMQNFNYFEFPPGTQTIICTASASPVICQSTSSIDIEIIAAPSLPVITQEGNTLIASGTGTFVWGFNEGVFTNTTNTLQMTESGTYSVYIEGVCPSAEAFGFYTYTTVLENDAFTFQLYPNPASQWIRIAAHSMNGTIEVKDMIGRVVYQNQLNSNSIIDIADWSIGTYVITLRNEERIINEIFVKE